MNIKITKKGNVKVDGTKYVFKVGGRCGDCAFEHNERVCDAAPCAPNGRRDAGWSPEDGHFIKKESKL
jgi:hypothetical protein